MTIFQRIRPPDAVIRLNTWLLSSVVPDRRNRMIFLVICSIACTAFTFAIPSYYPLRDGDTGSYLGFSFRRTAFYPEFLRLFLWLGFTLEQIAYIQVLLFSIALIVLLAALLRAKIPPILVIFFVLSLGANGYFSTVHWTIMTESLFATVTVIATAFWIDYFRTGKIYFLACTGAFVGITIGIRPTAMALIPMIVISAWLKWRQRDVSIRMFAAVLILPLTIAIAAERVIHRIEHGANNASMLPIVLTGKAAMLIREDTVFEGPYAPTLNRLGREFYQAYSPVHKFIDGIPSVVAWPVLTSFFESVAHFHFLHREIEQAGSNLGVSPDVLRMELAKRAILNDPVGYVRLSLLHLFGQWSVTALTLPPTARAVTEYAASQSSIPFSNILDPVVFTPPPKWRSYVVYPAFAFAGIVTLILSFMLAVFLIRPSSGDRGRGRWLMQAAFFAAVCQASMLMMSLVGVSTPRYLMAVYPQIVLTGLFLIMAVMPPPSPNGIVDPGATAPRPDEDAC